jgi:hypothetical protein
MLKNVKTGEKVVTTKLLQKEQPGCYRLGAGVGLEQWDIAGCTDLVNARKRELPLQNRVGIWVQNGAAALVILSFVGLLFCVLYRENDLPNKDIFNILLGILGTVVVQIFQYWFGASAGLQGTGTGTSASREINQP